ncbi:MAG: hypothetical protein IPL59_15780 [Candidatus Competibacteraceae bacterium]|uniref:Uncharacterized protein n=1 Tax=Candidatus Contendobacter odensis Run_B_J11 TaxID=1400861 RepID=A0A7U7J668_9GAMM|nr:hypothetical protein [Candidatus Contendobacter odensis]MBK8536453.1 hypothetical protein [Candidatus Competibacteraceae bacterium]MBK8753177.1 hypothetical protein [Candidatus Competibacteraceae bacterium]CDH47470.1 conserved hypothetical protein [Candidatus Contendobacter odensis Run_B_J11]
MEMLLLWIGRLAGLVGVVACLIAIGARLGGAFWIAGFQVGTLLQAGIAAMVLGCLAHLVVLTLRSAGGG